MILIKDSYLKLKSSIVYIFFIFLLFTVNNLATAPVLHAEEKMSLRMESIILAHKKIITEWASSSVLIEAVKKQNAKNITLNEIKKIDKEWVEGKKKNFALELQRNEVGVFLRKQIESNSIYVEAFLCDNQGAVVGEYPKTSDYWQGDEDKFLKCFNRGKGIAYNGPVEFDESTNTNSVQISIPVIADGQTIGVLIVGLHNIK